MKTQFFYRDNSLHRNGLLLVLPFLLLSIPLTQRQVYYLLFFQILPARFFHHSVDILQQDASSPKWVLPLQHKGNHRLPVPPTHTFRYISPFRFGLCTKHKSVQLQTVPPRKAEPHRQSRFSCVFHLSFCFLTTFLLCNGAHH